MSITSWSLKATMGQEGLAQFGRAYAIMRADREV
jgi:hypothetical protein